MQVNYKDTLISCSQYLIMFAKYKINKHLGLSYNQAHKLKIMKIIKNQELKANIKTISYYNIHFHFRFHSSNSIRNRYNTLFRHSLPSHYHCPLHDRQRQQLMLNTKTIYKNCSNKYKKDGKTTSATATAIATTAKTQLSDQVDTQQSKYDSTVQYKKKPHKLQLSSPSTSPSQQLS